MGGGLAGAAAGVYAARKGIRTGIAAERFGGQVNDTWPLKTISVLETDGPAGHGAKAHAKAYDVDIMNLQKPRLLCRLSSPAVSSRSRWPTAVPEGQDCDLVDWRPLAQCECPAAEYRKRVAHCPHL